MNPDELEELVAEFLDLRDEDPALSPEAFAKRHPPHSDTLLAAIRSTLQVIGAVSDAAPDQEQTIGPYDVVREIGRGGMGLVYEVERDGKKYALKLLPFAPMVGPRAMERFRRESETLAKLHHENIVTIHDSGLEQGAPYIVMDLIEGETLSTLAGTESTRRTAELVHTLALAVHSAHESGVFHRDLKPQNVMVRRDGRPILLDFGLTGSDDFASLTSTGDLVGTPRYMAPERVAGQAADARTDVYGLGMILYELISGRPAFEQDSRDVIIEAVVRGRFLRPRVLQPGLKKDLERVILKAIALDPKHRYPDARALAEDLDRFLNHEPVRGRPPGWIQRTMATIRREPAKATLSMLVLLAVAAAGFSFTRTSGAPSPEALKKAREAATRGLVFWLDKKPADAGREIERALEWHPENPIARALLLDIRETAPSPGDSASIVNLTEGLRLYREQKRSEARSFFEAVEKEDPRNILASVMLARVARSEERMEEADRRFQEVAGVLSGSAYVNYVLAWIAEKSQQLDKAAAACRRALEIDPHRSATWVLLAKISYGRGDIPGGIEAARKARDISGREDPYLLNLQASLLDERGSRVEARKIFRRILEQDPDNVQVRGNLAMSYDSDHRVVEAEREYRRAAERSRDTKSLIGLAHMYSGADRGNCIGCDEAYAMHPEYYDLEKAMDFLIQAIHSDRAGIYKGGVLDIAKKFEERQAIIDALEKIVAEERGTERGRQMDWVLRRLRIREEVSDQRD